MTPAADPAGLPLPSPAPSTSLFAFHCPAAFPATLSPLTLMSPAPSLDATAGFAPAKPPAPLPPSPVSAEEESSFCLGTVSSMKSAAITGLSAFGDAWHYEREMPRSGNNLPLIACGAAVALLGLQIARHHHRRWRF